MRFWFTILISFVSISVYSQTVSIELAQQYYQQGELDKAFDTYSKLAKNTSNWPLIHNTYYPLLIQLNEFQRASKYIDKIIRTYSNNVKYKIDKGKLLFAEKGEAKANQYYQSLRNEFSSDAYTARRAAQYYLQIGERNQAIDLLLATRKNAGEATLFAMDLANIYRYMNKKQQMVEEYIVFANQNIGNLSYVQNALQVTLDKPEDIENLETYLFKKIQENPENSVYTELLIWANIQTKNFNSAFIQARALDRRLKQGGVSLIEIGKMALSNNDYQSASKIFTYIVSNYAESNIGVQAELLVITTKEEQVKNTYPLNTESLLELTGLYKNFIRVHPNNNYTFKASLQLALINGYYLDKKQDAISSLKDLINYPRLNAQLIAEAKLTLADIYLLNEEWWESTLLYAQVDKTMKETPIGYEAKLKRAKLAYYQGEFELAQAILDILKLATSREIANDALDLSIFIKENTLFDSTNLALKKYAAIELFIYQHKNNKVFQAIDSAISEFKGQGLVDNFLMLKANELKRIGDFKNAEITYAKIVENFGYDVLGDKALFLQAEINELYLENLEKAKELYVKLLKNYPGSVYVADARKRFRKLRGDFQEEKETAF